MNVNMSVGKKVLFILSLLCIIIITAVVSTSLGAANITIWDACSTILNKFFPDHFNSGELAEMVVWQMRLPRILMAILAGIGLAVAGTIFQSTFRNPLASPYTFGVLAAAAFGASLATVVGIESSMISLPVAIMMSTVASFFIYRFVKRGAPPEAAVLIGIASLFLFSILTPLLLLFTEVVTAGESMFLRSGNLDRASWTGIGIVFFILLFCIPLLLLKSRDFDKIADTKSITEDETTRNMGIFIASLMSAVIVCFVGMIGFIGLVAPFITKMILGGEHRFLIPASGLLGGALLLGLDAVARMIMAPVIIPVHFLTSLIGIPLFIYLIIGIVIRSEHQ